MKAINAYAVPRPGAAAEPFSYQRALGSHDALVRVTYCAIARGDVELQDAGARAGRLDAEVGPGGHGGAAGGEGEGGDARQAALDELAVHEIPFVERRSRSVGFVSPDAPRNLTTA